MCLFVLCMNDRNAFLLLIFKTGAQLPAGRRDIIATLGTDTIAHTVLREHATKSLNSLRVGSMIVGARRINGDAVHVGELFERREQRSELVRVFGAIVHAGEQHILESHLPAAGGDVVLHRGHQVREWIFFINRHGLAE